MVMARRYEFRATYADGNQQLISSYRSGRSGDLITIAGKVVRIYPDPIGTPRFGIEIDDISRVVTLSGLSLKLCAGDWIAASGTYQYNDAGGGSLRIDDVANVATYRNFTPYGPSSSGSRIDMLLMAIYGLFPSWCPPWGASG
jgi:hypothetical protein